jgi:hypothetical protein
MTPSFYVLREDMGPDHPTRGELLIEGEHACYTLERPWLNNRESVSCIPLGTYGVELAWSEHWGRDIPHVMNVPGRTAIEMHPGNFVYNSIGCILLGKVRQEFTLGRSVAAVDDFCSWLQSVGGFAGMVVMLAPGAQIAA